MPGPGSATEARTDRAATAVAAWLAAFAAYRDSGHAPPPARFQLWAAYTEARTQAVVALLDCPARRLILPTGDVWSTDGLLVTYRTALPNRRSA